MEQKINNFYDLSNDELLSLHATILEHLKYLEEQIISEEASSEEEVQQEENSNEDGGDDNE